MQHIIWTNNVDYDDWKEDLEEQYQDKTEEERMKIMYELNDEYFEDEINNLNKELHRSIIVSRDLGLWNGRANSAGFVNGTNLNDIFKMPTCGEYVTYYVEDGELKCRDTHHDGTNIYVFRLLKEGVEEYELIEYSHDISLHEAVEKYTEPMGRFVSEIYGWETEHEAV